MIMLEHHRGGIKKHSAITRLVEQEYHSPWNRGGKGKMISVAYADMVALRITFFRDLVRISNIPASLPRVN
jgi:hypothetical protein